MTEKEALVKRVLTNPHQFSEVDEKRAISLFNFSDIRGLVRRIYDLNEASLLEMSDASEGALGKKNKKATEKRLEEYYHRVNSGHRVHNPKFANKVILCEGDSWFQFPVLIKDIIDWICEDQRNAVYSIAYAGDWVTNIIYEGDYVGELAVHQPDAFLISGGGNDLLGRSRLAVMLRRPDQLTANPKDYIKDEFYSFILTLRLMYRKMFSNIENSGKYAEMKIITQGYAYPFPRLPKFLWHRPLNKFFNQRIGSGKWITRPMDIVGIPDERTGEQFKCLRRQIMIYMIDYLNEMFIGLTDLFSNVFHVDCRAIGDNKEDWFDEIHLRSKNYQPIANEYLKIIQTDISKLRDKVYKAKKTP